MAKKKLLLSIIFLMLFMFIVDLLAHKFYLFYTLWWFDIPMHFLGGFWVGLFFIYVFFRKDSLFKSYWKVIFCAFLIGILWELFEVFAHQHIAKIPFDAWDTSFDLLLDIFGSGVALIYFYKTIMNDKGSAV